MLRFIFSLLFKFGGYTLKNDFPEETKRCVLLAGPHTSNWDLIYTVAAFKEMKIPYRFTIKKEWLKFPFGGMIKPLGGIGINRKPKVEGEKRLSMVEAMANLFEEHEQMALVITMEGTRSRVEEIKTGFYHLAQQAKVPIAFGYIDYKKKIAGIGKVIDYNQSYEAIKKEIYDFYSKVTPKFPENNSFTPLP